MSTKLTIDTSALLHNMSVINDLAKKKNVSVSVVTKGLVGNEALVGMLVKNGASSICEAHIENLIRFENLRAEKWLIRSPLLSEADETVRFADVSLVSERAVLKKLSEFAEAMGKTHKAVIMLELGELREGCMPEELIPLCEYCLSLPGLTLHGIGTHLSSINEIVPDESNMTALADAAAEVEDKLNIKLPLVSGGSSSAVKMLSENTLPARINHLRIGEAILLGNVVCYDVPFEDARTDVFSLTAEIIEVKDKPPAPWGELADGTIRHRDGSSVPKVGLGGTEEPSLCPLRKRALVAVGKQDVPSNYLIPEDPDMVIVGDTSDCFIADLTDCQKTYKPGDTLSFRLKYNGLVSAMASDYIEKIIL